MANITTETRADFQAKVKPVKAKIEEALKKEKDMLLLMKKDSAGIEYKKLLLCEEMLYVSTLYMSINSLSETILETKNNDALNDARKMIYKAIIYLEEIVSDTVDCPYADIAPRLEKISNTPLEKRFYLVRKMGLAIQLLVEAFGDNSKWKWSFVELRGRFAVVAKNLIDMKEGAKSYFDPASPDHDNTVLYIRLLRKLLDKSASEYRDRYELSTRRIDDMRLAINFLIALRRIAMILGESEESEEIKKKAVVWKGKMENDTKSGASK
ncbi:MAG: hypothetical protein J5780_05750 [Treponema sp.]|nr:hypothetical protein [Treponema sp.]